MAAKLTFLGAAQNVTGSCYLLDIDGTRLLVDCGMYQERGLKDRNWEPFPFKPAELDAVLLTHAHLDHCGRLPRLVNEGFKGPIYCTGATAEIADIVLQDAGKLQEEDAAYKKRRHEKEGRTGPYPEIALYTHDDAKAVKALFQHVRFDTPVQIAKGIQGVFHEAGHILGAASIRLTYKQDQKERAILFSGDIGRWNMPILRDPQPFEQADHVLIESTYGNRDHPNQHEPEEALAEAINFAQERGGLVLIPSFAVERAQDILYHLHGLLDSKRIAPIPVFLDSPMAVKVTEVFLHHPELFDEETMMQLKRGRHPCDFPGLEMTRTVKQSKAINERKGASVVIAGSGMCTGGRIKHHLFNHIAAPNCTLLFVGYQAVGTLGRIIVDGAKTVRIFGQEKEIHARVKQVHGFSGHADRNELLKWISALGSKPNRVFATHGELEAANALASLIGEKRGFDVTVPAYKDSVELS